MDGIMVAAIIVILFIFVTICYIAYKEIKRMKEDRENKKLFLNNSSLIKKGQSLDDVIELLGRPTSYTEMEDKYILKWEQTEETAFESIARSITIIVNKDEVVINVHRENLK